MIICELANQRLGLVFFTQLECVLYCTMFEINEPLFFYNRNCFVKPGRKKPNIVLFVTDTAGGIL